MPSLSLENLFISIHTPSGLVYHTPSGYGEPTQRQRVYSDGTYLKPLFIASISAAISCFFFWLEDNCFTRLCWFPIQQHESALNILHIHPLPPESPCKPLPPSHHSRSSQSTGLSSLYCSNSPLPIYFTYGDVYISMPLNSSHPLLPRVCLQVHSLHLHLFSCPEIHQYVFSRFHINALIYNICFSLSGILHSV